MQEVLLKSIPHLPKFESPSALAVWLYKFQNRPLEPTIFKGVLQHLSA